MATKWVKQQTNKLIFIKTQFTIQRSKQSEKKNNQHRENNL